MTLQKLPSWSGQTWLVLVDHELFEQVAIAVPLQPLQHVLYYRTSYRPCVGLSLIQIGVYALQPF